MSEMEAIVAEFIEEGNEKADQVERNLIQLEKNPGSPDLVAEVFRDLHSLKGATSFLGFSKLCTLTHTGESLLARLRDGKLTLTAEVTTALLALVDAIRTILTEIRRTGKEGDADYTNLANTLVRLQKAS